MVLVPTIYSRHLCCCPYLLDPSNLFGFICQLFCSIFFFTWLSHQPSSQPLFSCPYTCLEVALGLFSPLDHHPTWKVCLIQYNYWIYWDSSRRVIRTKIIWQLLPNLGYQLFAVAPQAFIGLLILHLHIPKRFIGTPVQYITFSGVTPFFLWFADSSADDTGCLHLHHLTQVAVWTRWLSQALWALAIPCQCLPVSLMLLTIDMLCDVGQHSLPLSQTNIHFIHYSYTVTCKPSYPSMQIHNYLTIAIILLWICYYLNMSAPQGRRTIAA